MLRLTNIHFAIIHDLDVVVLRLGQILLFCRLDAAEIEMWYLLIKLHSLINSTCAVGHDGLARINKGRLCGRCLMDSVQPRLDLLVLLQSLVTIRSRVFTRLIL